MKNCRLDSCRWPRVSFLYWPRSKPASHAQQVPFPRIPSKEVYPGYIEKVRQPFCMILSSQCHCLKIYVTLKDNYPSNKISIDEATLIEIRLKKKKQGGEGSGMPANKCRRNGTVRKLSFGQHHNDNWFRQETSMNATKSGRWMLGDKENIDFTVKHLPTKWLLITKRKTVTF